MSRKQKEVVDTAFQTNDDPALPGRFKPLPPDTTGKGQQSKQSSQTPAKGEKGNSSTATKPAMSKTKSDIAARMDLSSSQLEALRSDAVLKISKCLAQGQKIAFNQLLGRRVKDLAELVPDEYISTQNPPAAASKK